MLHLAGLPPRARKVRISSMLPTTFRNQVQRLGSNQEKVYFRGSPASIRTASIVARLSVKCQTFYRTNQLWWAREGKTSAAVTSTEVVVELAPALAPRNCHNFHRAVLLSIIPLLGKIREEYGLAKQLCQASQQDTTERATI